jgi:hypothetical protein
MHYLSANVSGGLFAIATFSALAYQCPQLLASSPIAAPHSANFSVAAPE